jgi:ABC-type nitrate/sulfonate/bicarbonate transport system substrate-binding protein
MRFLPASEKRRQCMKKLALGLVAAATLLTAAVPAMAQVGFYAGPAGVGVGVAPPDGYYDYYGGPPGVYVGPGWRYHHHWHRWHRW